MFSEETFNPTALIYRNLIKYSSMDKMFKKEFMGCSSQYVNVYIDLFSFLSDLYRTTITNKSWNIVSSLVNMGIHYRNYFGKKGMYSNIIFVYSANQCESNIKYIKDWYIHYRNQSMNNPMMTKTIMNTIELLGYVIPFVPDMFLKIDRAAPSVSALNIINRFINKGFNYPNIFVTRDPYAFQLPSILPNVVLFFKKYKKNGEDVSKE